MSTSSPHGKKHRPTSKSSPNHCVDDRLSQKEFELLLRGAISLDPGFALQCEFMIQVCGRLGLRAGELAHMKEDWIDFREQIIHIPKREPCSKGRDGGPCGQCWQQARQMADIRTENRLDEIYSRDLDVLEPGNLVTPEVFVDPEPLAEERWRPKTDSAARAVPYGYDPRATIIIERFFDKYDEWPVSQNAIGRRLNRAADATDTIDAGDIYPHCLRATAATYHAGRGLRAINLQALFGWADLQTARKYVRISGEAVSNALDSVHA